MLDTEILIVGAGPTGMTLALWLARYGVRPRIIDRAAGPGTTSRALAVQARTLEFHRQIGIVDSILDAGTRIERLVIRTRQGQAAALDLSAFGEGLSPYPFAFALPQDEHERILLAHLHAAGITVEYGTELAAFTDHGAAVAATLRRDGREEHVTVQYLVGADGAHSKVRQALGIGFPGGTYDQSFYVADAEATGPITRNGMDITLGRYGFSLVMPVRRSGSLRLIGIVPRAMEGRADLAFADIQAEVERDSGLKVHAVNWFSTYRVHHRVAERFRQGRAFLAGDAGHIHSPAGGQGMNTGMGDAVNLAWKLAAVVQGRADPGLLDTYEPERIAFARLLIASTDRAFRLLTGRSWLAGLWRRHAMPRLMAAAMRTRWGQATFFRLVSQIRINYRGSPLSEGGVGGLAAGDRMPWVRAEGADSLDPLRSLDWQVHVHGAVATGFDAALAGAGFPVHRFAWTEAAGAAGIERDAAYLLRPDGHIALASAAQDPGPFLAWLAARAIRPRGAGMGACRCVPLLAAA